MPENDAARAICAWFIKFYSIDRLHRLRYNKVTMSKKSISTIYEKNRIIDNIIDIIFKKKSFLVCGHKNPDVDCIASMVAFSLLLITFDKDVQIYIDDATPSNAGYLFDICLFNSIKILNSGSPGISKVDTIVACDTAKRSMLGTNQKIDTMLSDESILKIEIDHHLGTDSDYTGDAGYCLIMEAGSAAELVGHLAIKLSSKKELLPHHMKRDILSKNFSLAVISGIIGDTDMGKYLKSKREKVYYQYFTNFFNDIFMKPGARNFGFKSIYDIFHELHKQSDDEIECFHHIASQSELAEHIAYVVLSEEEMESLCDNFSKEIISSVIRAISNELAERSGYLSLVAYYHDDLVSFKMRRCQNFKGFDLRDVITLFSIKNGGGHEGAIAFRFPRDSIEDLEEYVPRLVERVESELDLKINLSRD